MRVLPPPGLYSAEIDMILLDSMTQHILMMAKITKL